MQFGRILNIVLLNWSAVIAKIFTKITVLCHFSRIKRLKKWAFCSGSETTKI